MNAEQFLGALESSAGRPLNERETLGRLVGSARTERASAALLEAAFHAKFAVRSQEVMRRIGAGADGFDKLASEFQASLERVTGALRELIADADPGMRSSFEASYLRVDEEALARLLRLCDDLARVKNWEVDGKPLPFGGAEARKAAPAAADPVPERRRILRASRLALALFLFFLMFERPVSIVGWVVAFLIVGLFIVIEYEAHQRSASKGS